MFTCNNSKHYYMFRIFILGSAGRTFRDIGMAYISVATKLVRLSIILASNSWIPIVGIAR